MTQDIQPYTIELPQKTFQKLKAHVPRNQWDKFIAQVLEQCLAKEKIITPEKIGQLWEELDKKALQ